MEDVIFLDHDFVPPQKPQENGQQGVQNCPEPNGNQHIVRFYGNMLPANYLQQLPSVREAQLKAYEEDQLKACKAQYGIPSYSITNQNPPTAFPVPPSTSQQGLVTTEQKNYRLEPIPLRRNPIRSVKKVSLSNLIGPNGTYTSSSKIPRTKQSTPKPLIPKTSKIPKVDKIRPPTLLIINQSRPKSQAAKKQKIQKVDKRVPAAPPPKPPAPKKAKIQKVEKTVPAARASPPIPPTPKVQNVKKRAPTATPPAPKKAKIQKVEKPSTVVLPAVPMPEENSSYQRLLALQESDLVSNTAGVICPVCNFWVPPNNGVVLKDCLHYFCRKCLQSAVQKSQTALVKCPFVCPEYECESHLQDREVKSLVSPDDYERHLARSVFQAQCQATNAFHCVMPGCNGWCLVDDIHSTWFACPMCKLKNCIPCRAIHNEMGCPNDDGVKFLGEVVNKLEKELQASENHSVFGELTDLRPLTNSEDQPVDYRNLLDLGPLTNSEDQPVDYRNLLEATDMGLVTNTESFDCPICFSYIAIGEGVTLKDCLHNYCRECLIGTIRHSDAVLVKCPFVNDEYSCESFLQDREIKSLLTPDEFERHLAMSLALVERQSANSFHCKTPDCAGWCLVEDDANQFYCLVCQHSNCLSCAAIHEGKNCKQYQDMADLDKDVETKKYLEGLVKSNKAMACPTCQIIVVKRDGCDWLVCSMCQTEICWATKGPRWGPGGKGDTSGGCKCDLKKRKPCHPNCYNCH